MRILDNRLVKILLLMIAVIGINITAIIFTDFDIKPQLTVTYTVEATKPSEHQLFYSLDGDWREEDSIRVQYDQAEQMQQLKYILPRDVEYIRLDIGDQTGEILLSDFKINYLWNSIDLSSKVLNDSEVSTDILGIKQMDKKLMLQIGGSDPYIAISLDDNSRTEWSTIDRYIGFIFKILSCIIVNILLVVFIRKRKIFMGLIKDLINSRNLIWRLSLNDFKTKYAGSYLGITWAFVQPVVTILVYWFVFQVGFKSAPIENFPFVLWLVAGIVPWFFFSEALINATNSMIEYSYLVKKVVFKISILPIVKIFSSLFVHLFFIAFTLILFGLYGYMPDIYAVQVIYYTICMIILVLGICYATSAIVVFFRDLGQIISIFMQVGMWMTPIMWSYDMIPLKYQWILKLNPMYYIVEGYRDSLINKIWFWEKSGEFFYFWILTIGLYGIGCIVFKKLKIHFADVL